MTLYITISASIVLNILLFWYVVRLLRKFLFISETISDLYLTTKAFQVFARSLYSMDTYHGEPMIQELVFKTKEVIEEVENFRDIFEYTLDEEIEEELNAAEEEASSTH